MQPATPVRPCSRSRPHSASSATRASPLVIESRPPVIPRRWRFFRHRRHDPPRRLPRAVTCSESHPRQTTPGWTVATATGKPSVVPIPAKLSVPGGAHVTPTPRPVLTHVQAGHARSTRPFLRHHCYRRSRHPARKGRGLVEVPANFPPARVTTPSFACTLAPGSAAGIETNDGSSTSPSSPAGLRSPRATRSCRLADAMAAPMGPKSATPWPPYRLTKDDDLGQAREATRQSPLRQGRREDPIHHARRNAQSR